MHRLITLIVFLGFMEVSAQEVRITYQCDSVDFGDTIIQWNAVLIVSDSGVAIGHHSALYFPYEGNFLKGYTVETDGCNVLYFADGKALRFKNCIRREVYD